MDSKDSSSSAPIVSRESVSFLEDEGIMSVAAVLAKDASFSFHSGKFAECIDALNQLLQRKEDDLKVLHNLAIATYFQEGCSGPKKLIEMLSEIKKRSDDLTCAYGEQAETVGDSVNKTITGSKGNNNSLHITLANSSHIGHGDKLDTSVVMLNIAVILFHLREYAKASSILDTLYQKIEPIDEVTALRICLLFMDVALILEDSLRFIEVTNYVEKAFCIGNTAAQSDGTIFIQQQSSNNTMTKSHSAPINTTISDSSNADSPMSGNTTEGSLLRTLSEENLENLISTMDMTGQSIIRASNSNLLSSSSEILRIPVDQYISTNDLRLKLHLYKVRFMLFTKNIKAAKREIKVAMAMNVASGKDSSMALLLKSQLEYARGNYRKAIKLVMASSGNRTEQGISSLCYNNLGCIYYRLGKQNASAIFFSKALDNCKRKDDGPLKLATFSQDKSLQITYNCGVQYLSSGKPLLAEHCFRKASSIFKDRPLLWLRIAECCLMELEILNRISDIKLLVIGKGKWRQLAVDDEKDMDIDDEQDDMDNNNKQSDLSFSLAKKCLVNALYLLNQKNSNGDSTLDWEGSRGRENQMMKQAVLADLAYVELELGNPLKSLYYSELLLKLPECSKIYIFLGNIYAAEALCLLDQPKEASEHLFVYLANTTGNGEQLPYSDEDCEQWKTVTRSVDSEEMSNGSHDFEFLKPREGCGSLYSSLAALMAVQGDLEQARQFAERALTLLPTNREAIITATYIDLVIGNVEEALVRLKQSSSVRFVPSSGLEMKSLV
ncbi:CCR4-NOT transcription complex subunit 10-like [Impatiens glandulifera]|uniref:CCR4-NOT transcription complex subunit 10-like n=1 Tax=Impatiens glandulifera TaxID=253017 RepID=UPI001FB056E1|nr:CCR4-NOT transcription complex subunit 10-like [Impatiens glandulifera]